MVQPSAMVPAPAVSRGRMVAAATAGALPSLIQISRSPSAQPLPSRTWSTASRT
jgi:hypothetical protein